MDLQAHLTATPQKIHHPCVVFWVAYPGAFPVSYKTGSLLLSEVPTLLQLRSLYPGSDVIGHERQHRKNATADAGKQRRLMVGARLPHLSLRRFQRILSARQQNHLRGKQLPS